MSLNQRARYPEDWHPFDYFMDRVALLSGALIAVTVGGIVAFSFWTVAQWL